MKYRFKHSLAKLVLGFLSIAATTGSVHAQRGENHFTWQQQQQRQEYRDQKHLFEVRSSPPPTYTPLSRTSGFHSYNRNYDIPISSGGKRIEQEAPIDPENAMLAAEKDAQNKRDKEFKATENKATQAQAQRDKVFKTATKKTETDAQAKLNKEINTVIVDEKKAQAKRDAALKAAESAAAKTQAQREKQLKDAQNAATKAQAKRDQEIKTANQRAATTAQAKQELEFKAAQIKEKDAEAEQNLKSLASQKAEKDTQAKFDLQLKVAEKEKQDAQAKQNLELKLAALRTDSGARVKRDLELLFTRKEEQDTQAKEAFDRKAAEKAEKDAQTINNQKRRETLRSKNKDQPKKQLEHRDPSPFERTLSFNPDYQTAFIYRLQDSDGPIEDIVLNREYLIFQGNKVIADIQRKIGDLKGYEKKVVSEAYRREQKVIKEGISMLEKELKNFSEQLVKAQAKAQARAETEKAAKEAKEKEEADKKAQKEQNKDQAAQPAEPDTKHDQTTVDTAFLISNAEKAAQDRLNRDIEAAVEGVGNDDGVKLGHAFNALERDAYRQGNQEVKDDSSKTQTDPEQKPQEEPKVLEQCEVGEQSKVAEDEQGEYGEILDFEADTLYIASALNNFNAIFNGERAPDMETFDNLMGSFMGKEDSAGGDYAYVTLDSNMEGDYVLTSVVHQNKNAGVFMEIGRVTKVNDCETSYSDGSNSDDSLSFRSAKASQEQGTITFALYRQGEQFLVATDLTSATNYIAQKTVESYVFLTPSPAANGPTVDPNTLSVYGLENADPNFVQRATSVIADFLPYIGTGKAITELFLGYDPITGEKVHFVVAGFGIIGSFVPIPGAAKACKFMGKGFVLGAEFIAKNPEIFGKKVIGRNVNKISNEPPDFIKKFWPDAAKKGTVDAGDVTHPSTPVGHKGKEIKVLSGTNSRTSIHGREYSGHALDRMQERGVTPTMVEHVIQDGLQSPGNMPNRILHYDLLNEVLVVTENGNVITVRFGEVKI